jgi:hypothetical protein
LSRYRTVRPGAVWIASLMAAGSCARDRPAPPRPLPDEAFRVEWNAHTVPETMKPGSRIPVSIRFKNVGPVTWPAATSTGYPLRQGGAVRMAYHWWWPRSPLPIGRQSARADLERPLAPGDSATLTLVVAAPEEPGAYTLQIDLLQELVAWFEAKGAAQLLVPVRVE